MQTVAKLTTATLVIASLLAPAAAAGHGGDPVIVHRTYEEAHHNFAILTGFRFEDPTGLTADGTIDLGGAVIFPEDVPDGVNTVQASIVDDIWGPGAVAGWLCVDVNGDSICDPEDDEPSLFFCGDSVVVDIPAAPGWNFINIIVAGSFTQALICDITAAPTGGTHGGVLDPAGGIFATVT